MNLDLSKIKKVFFIGIGGIGISAIARMMHLEGKEVMGSDMSRGEVSIELEKHGIQVVVGQGMDLVPADVDLIVYTIAIETYDPELFTKLKAQSIPIRSYPEMLGIVSRNKITIAVAGTHGKTTTTAMIGHVLRATWKDPSMIVGSLMVGDRSNFWAGKSDLFVVEACEYRRSFLNINPTILVITNIDEDHLDYYKDLEDIISAFYELAMKVPKNGAIVCDPTDKNVARAIKDATAKIIWAADFKAQRKLLLPGAHNQFDASLAAAAASVVGVSENESTEALETFPGTWRRFEYKGKLSSGAIVYDDYAHHPREIEVTAAAFREKFPKSEGYKLTAFFQPHLYSRTKSLFDDFVKNLALFDHIYVLPIYAAREVDDGSVSSLMLSQAIATKGTDSQAVTFEEAKTIVQSGNFSDHDVLVTLGAGEAYTIMDNLTS